MTKSLLSDINFNHLLKGSAFNAAAKILGTAFGFLASFLIAKQYGADLVGRVATITSVFTLLSLIALFGNQTLVLKVIPEHIEKYSYAIAKQIYFMLISITLWFTFGVMTVWLFLEKSTSFTLIRGLEHYIFLIAALLVLSAFRRLNTKCLRGLGDYKIYSLFELLPPILLAITAIIAIWLNVSEYNFQYVYFLPLLTMGFLSFFFVFKTFEIKIKNDKRPLEQSPLPTKRSLIRVSLPMFGVTLSGAIIAHFDILMLNFYTTPSVVGVYSIYVKIVAITALGTQSINAMFAPTVSRLFSSDKNHELKSFAKRATLLSFTVTLGLSLPVILFHEPLLLLYGPAFLGNTSTLFIILVSSIVSSFFGSAGLYLNMTGHQVAFFRIMIFAALMNVGLNVIFIPLWGATGAALATLLSVVTWNLLATRKILLEHKFTLIWSGGRYA